jgi:hypothetical protein
MMLISWNDQTKPDALVREKAYQTLLIWTIFFAQTILINILIPISLGLNLYDWTFSKAKGLLLFSGSYAGFFLVLPLLLTKGWQTFKKPNFIIPVIAAAVSVVLWYPLHYIATLAIVVYVYLHWKFDLSELGFRTKGWRGDTIALLIVGSFSLLLGLSSSSASSYALLPAFYSTLFRLFGNPASTVENVFYFGFLTNRLGKRWNRYIVPLLVGAMYTAHELSNPEYWYEGLSFINIFIGVTLMAAIYLWRRSMAVTWLSDGLDWFIRNLI